MLTYISGYKLYNYMVNYIHFTIKSQCTVTNHEMSVHVFLDTLDIGNIGRPIWS